MEPKKVPGRSVYVPTGAVGAEVSTPKNDKKKSKKKREAKPSDEPRTMLSFRSMNDNWGVPLKGGYGDDEGLTYTQELFLRHKTGGGIWTGRLGIEALVDRERGGAFDRVDSYRLHVEHSKVLSWGDNPEVTWARELGAGVHMFGKGGLGLSIQNGWHSLIGAYEVDRVTYTDELKIGPAVSAGLVRRAQLTPTLRHDAAVRGYASAGEQRGWFETSLRLGGENGLYGTATAEGGYQNVDELMALGYRNGFYKNFSLEVGHESRRFKVALVYGFANEREVPRLPQYGGGYDPCAGIELGWKFDF